MSRANSADSRHDERFRAAGWGGGRPASHTGATSSVAERAERTSNARRAGWESAASSGSKSSLSPLIEQLASLPPTGTAWNGGQNSAYRRRSETGSRSHHSSKDSVATPAARGLSSAPGSKEPFNSPFRIPSLHSLESESTPGHMGSNASGSMVTAPSLGASIRAMSSDTPLKGSMESMISPGRAAPVKARNLSFSQLAERSKQAAWQNSSASRQNSVTSRRMPAAGRPLSAGSRLTSPASQQGSRREFSSRPNSASSGQGTQREISTQRDGARGPEITGAGHSAQDAGQEISPRRQGAYSDVEGQEGNVARSSGRSGRKLLGYQRPSESQPGSFARRQSAPGAFLPEVAEPAADPAAGNSAGTTPREAVVAGRMRDAAAVTTRPTSHRGSVDLALAPVDLNEDIVQRWVDDIRMSVKTASRGRQYSMTATSVSEAPPPRERWERRNLHRTGRTRIFGLLRGGHRFYSMVRRVCRSDADAVDEVNVLQAEREPGFSPSYAIYKGNGSDKELVGVVQSTNVAMDTFILMVPPNGSPKAVCDPNTDPVQLAIGFQNLNNQRHITVLIPETGIQAVDNSSGTEDLGVAAEIQRSMKRAQAGEGSLPDMRILRTKAASGKEGKAVNFGGRVLFASLKNVQLEVVQQSAWAGATPMSTPAEEKPENSHVVFQCGRRGDDTFACDFISPLLSEHQAFALSIAIMVPKACYLFL